VPCVQRLPLSNTRIAAQDWFASPCNGSRYLDIDDRGLSLRHGLRRNQPQPAGSASALLSETAARSGRTISDSVPQPGGVFKHRQIRLKTSSIGLTEFRALQKNARLESEILDSQASPQKIMPLIRDIPIMRVGFLSFLWFVSGDGATLLVNRPPSGCHPTYRR